MAIHHSTVKKAEKMGVFLSEVEGSEQVRAFWSKRGVEFIGSSVGDAMTQMQAIQALCASDEYVVRVANEPRMIHVHREKDGHILKGGPYVPLDAMQLVNVKKTAEFVPISVDSIEETLDHEEQVASGDVADTGGADPEPAVGIARSSSGVALDGAAAYREGTPAGDNPYTTETEDDEEYANAARWDEEWDAAADQAAEEDDAKGGSVVSGKYRAIYAERGHPTHCGDWMAELLNKACQNKDGTDLARFEAICEANGVDMGKYNRESPGWQGRFRMTGRNLLAKKVYLAGGVILIPSSDPEAGGSEEHRAPAEWLEAQRYKMPKSEQAKPIPEAK